jgi:hypothetical protein
MGSKGGAGANRALADVPVLEFDQRLKLARQGRISLLPETGSDAAIAICRFSLHRIGDRQQVLHRSDRFIGNCHAVNSCWIPEIV